ncbi:MAG TPA: alpha/beta hydrolase [Candidatus Limnocylindrales bacterium]|nr:alpha/beta hydrolase [Candidatus Limnocylindrales bacterium]
MSRIPDSAALPRSIRQYDVSAGGVRLRVLESPGQGPAVVLLHGAGSNARSWLPLMRALAGRQVLALDLPGHGASSQGPTHDLYETADVVREVIETEVGRGAVLGGHSWGGKLSGCMAASDPALCAGLVLIDPSPSHAVPVDIESFVEMAFGVELAEYDSAEEAATAARTIPRYSRWDDDIAAAFLGGLARQENGKWSLRPGRAELTALCRGVLWTDASEILARAAQLPTLLVVAGESVWQAQTNVLAYADATLVTLAGSHWIHHDDPAGLASAVTSWLDERFPLGGAAGATPDE